MHSCSMCGGKTGNDPDSTVLCDECIADNEHSQAAARAERDALRARAGELERLISDDAFSVTFQTLGQYRSALLKALRG